jgi:hypothetical protein
VGKGAEQGEGAQAGGGEEVAAVHGKDLQSDILYTCNLLAKLNAIISD